MLKNKILIAEQLNKHFNLKEDLDKAIKIYNTTKHSTIRFTPEFEFNSNDTNLFVKIKQKTINSQKYNKNKYNHIIENKLGLLCVPIHIIKSNSNNIYIIRYENIEPNKDYIAEYTLLKLSK